MKFIQARNNKAVRLKDIPELSIKEFSAAVIEQSAAGKRVIGFFSSAETAGRTKVYAVLADDEISKILISSCVFSGEKKYPSITLSAPALHMFERELYEETGIEPEGHPWLKPVRYGHERNALSGVPEKYPFYKMQGEQVHEVAVGPVHAGVIEPGHFRFNCTGETVQHLEIQLGYQHRGIEKMMANGSGRYMTHLAESIAGDTVVGHVTAYCGAIEALSGCDVPRRAQVIRAVALELERAAMHAGDLSAIANDIAYLMGNAVFGANRTALINTSLLICGSRFGRGLVRPGGVVFDIDEAKAKQAADNMNEAFSRMEQMAEEMFSAASVMSRLQQTGCLSRGDAVSAGVTGFAARASGVAIDSRADHPSGAYVFFPVNKKTLDSGDVFARAYLRYMEMRQSVGLINEMLSNMPDSGLLGDCELLVPDAFGVSVCEGWRGEIVHAGITGKDGKIKRLKIKDPSFNNWYGLALAMRGNGISDFPLTNKSFDLSYCGNDL